MPDNDCLLREYHEQPSFEVDREKGEIRGVKLCGQISKNQRRYSHAAMVDLEQLYFNKPIRINHDEKSYLATVGSVQDVVRHQITEEIRGTISLNKGHPRYEQIMEDAEKRPHLLQLSHEVPAKKYTAHRDGEQLVVDRVYAVNCFAIVTNGGVNDSLFEEVTEDEEMELKNLAELRSQFPALYEELVSELKTETAENEKLAEAIQQRDAANAALHEAQQELERRDAAARLEQLRSSILQEAAELKVQCSEDLLEALMVLPTEKRSKVLKCCPKLKEDGGEPAPEKPQQRSGLKQVRGYSSPVDWIEKFAKN